MPKTDAVEKYRGLATVKTISTRQLASFHIHKSCVEDIIHLTFILFLLLHLFFFFYYKRYVLFDLKQLGKTR